MLAATLSATVAAAADEAPPLPRDNFGGVGLIEMPSARMAPDGELSFGASFFLDTQHYYLGFQALPWLETSFRYSGIQHFDSLYPVYFDRSFAVKARLWDEDGVFPALAIGIDDLVGTGVYGGEYVVASKRLGDFDASLGIGWGRLGSTGLFKNPLILLSNSFANRPAITTGGNADFSVLFHGPKSGLFGGVVWHTPVERLSLTAEYSSDRYLREASAGGFRPRNQLNFGASYQLEGGIILGANWLYGRSIGGSIDFQLDPKTAPPQKLGPDPLPVNIRSEAEQQEALAAMMQRSGQTAPATQRSRLAASKNAFVDALWREGPTDIEVRGRTLVLRAGDMRDCAAAVSLVQAYGGDIDTIAANDGHGQRCAVPAALRSANDHTAPADPPAPLPAGMTSLVELSTIDASSMAAGGDAALRALRRDADRQQIFIEAAMLGYSDVTVYYANSHYFAEIDAVDRLTRILMADMPPAVERFRLIAVQDGVPQRQFDILRGPQERAFAQDGRLVVLAEGSTQQAPPLENPILAAAAAGSYPRFSWDIFPQLREQLFDPNSPFAIQLLLGIDGKLELLPGLSLNAEAETSLYDNFNKNRPDDSVLPHVRSDFLKYFAQGKTGIGELDAQYRFRLAPSVFAVAKAGYLESMFAGAGGEVLWRPENQRWALGADLYEAWQRDFDRLFGLQNYHVLTGHISVYYASPWYGLNFAVRAGRYLAGDRGLTFEATRRFSTGVEVGAFFTRTNVSATQFGEGSFDKGIIIRIPLGWISPIETQGQLGLDLRPVQRDGGQRLQNDAILYDETRRTSNAAEPGSP